jgi:hypothetical protein
MSENFWNEGDWHLMPRISILQATILSYNLNPSEVNPQPLIISPTEIHIFVNPSYDTKGVSKEQLSRRFLIILENARKEGFLIDTLNVDFPKFAFWAKYKLQGISEELIKIGESYIPENDYWIKWQSKFNANVREISDSQSIKTAIPSPEATNRSSLQETLVLQILKDLDINPLTLPPQSGKLDVKDEVRKKALTNKKLFASAKVFNNAWQRLLKDGFIKRQPYPK